MKRAPHFVDPGRGDAWGEVGVKRAIGARGRPMPGDEGDAAQSAAWGGGLPRQKGTVEGPDDAEMCEGGAVKRKKGGRAEGRMAAQRLDRRARHASGGRLTAAERQSMPKSEFALPGKGKGPKGAGAGAYPLDTERRARSALARGKANATPAEQATIRRRVHAKYPDMQIKAND